MKWTIQYRLLRVIAIFAFLTSCDSGNGPSTASFESSQVKLTPPATLTRAVDPEVLFAEVTLSYFFNSAPVTIPPTIASRTGNSDAWTVALDVPANTDFAIVVTWYDTMDANQRLDLTTVRKAVAASAANSQLTLEFDFLTFDSSEFNEDGDSFTNLDERNNGTDPFVFTGDTQEPLVDDLTLVRYEEDGEYPLLVSLAELGGLPIVETSWELRPHTDENSSECSLLAGFNIDGAKTSLDEACTTSEDCSVTIDEVIQDTQVDSDIEFLVAVPPLKAAVSLSYQLVATNNAQETAARLFNLCLIAINEAPVAVDDSFTAIAGIPLTITAGGGVDLLSNDTDDVDESNQTLSISTSPERAPARAASFDLRSDGGFTYLYNAGPEGVGSDGVSDSFVYSVTDGSFVSNATVTLNIVSDDQPPVLISSIPAQSVVVGMGLAFDLSRFFEDPEGSELSFNTAAGTLPPSGGVIVTELGILSGAARPGDEGTYSVEVEARDLESLVTGILDLEVRENQRPIAGSIEDVGPVESGVLISVNVSESFSDPEGAALRFTLTSSPESALQINPVTGLITGRLANAGVYSLTVSATDGITESVSSSFTVTQNAPVVAILGAISPNSLSLNADVNQSDSSSVSFSNVGNALLNYSVTSDQSWIAATPSSGSVAVNGNESVQITAQCGEIEDTRTGTLSIGGDGGTRTVSVSIVCSQEAVPILSEIDPSSLSLSADVNQSDASSVSFSNDGNAVLNYSVTSNQPWITTEPASGSVAVNGNESVQITAQCGEIEDTRTGTLTIGGNGGTQTVAVSIVCSQEPVAILSEIDPASLVLSADVNQSDVSSVSFSNDGNAVLNYSVTSDQAWLTAEPASGSVAVNGNESLEVAAQCSEGEDTRKGTLTIGGNGGTRTVSVSIVCSPEPEAILRGVDPEALNLSAFVNVSPTSATSSFSFSNGGNAVLSYSVTSDQSWLSVKPVSGNVAVDGFQNIEVTGQCGQDEETRTGALFVDSNGGTQTVPVSIACTQGPEAILSEIDPYPESEIDSGPLELSAYHGNQGDFVGESEAIDSASISFRNDGNAVLNFSVSSSSFWLTATPVSGDVAADGSQSVEVTAQCGDIQEELVGTLSIDSNGGMRTLSVSLYCYSVIF
ncbi:BACON domain-containing protein [Granulosicoccus antarcticus]|uniref:BACON domain-containing protein n=1 Tax=Granulosicoccus antarcticus IMCC3135 TaxID=1192854 RepID=A0A2Z2NYB1_9GAMM|nr:BACON domain-containing carbohydrate-binding protein [Granulosicoccus antarcticus]ASJ76293.1 hypothetical protein IMCC3135_31225 [Granulosicoccus antarcticus IMCC3135]